MAARRRRTKAGEPAWAELPESELLEVRLRDLDLKIAGSWVEPLTQRLLDELKRKGMRFKPHFWLSNEWFSPDGVPGIAIPFYLAHPRLKQLERKQMFEVEGGTVEWCMRILRHEAGHTVDTAYRLRRRRRWQQSFGRASQRYPRFYTPNPHSQAYVHNLEWWYAQSHPVEDFAETFAVWLKPRSAWKRTYEGWRALKKLQYVDEQMAEIADLPARVRTRQQTDPLRTMDTTLGEHYAARRSTYGVSEPGVFDDQLERVFAPGRNGKRRETAAAFLRREATELRRMVAEWTGLHPYTVQQFLAEMIQRCRALGLKATRSERAIRLESAILLTVQAMAYAKGRRYRVAL